MPHRTPFFASMMGCFLFCAGFFALGPGPGEALAAGANEKTLVTVDTDRQTSNVTMANEHLRIQFIRGKPRFGIFPNSYTGYSLDLKEGSRWVPMARAPFISSYIYRSNWGRDLLSYVLGGQAEIKRDAQRATVTFTSFQWDLDRILWRFTFVFTLHAGRHYVETEFSASPQARRGMLLFWGPRLQLAEDNFGGAKDEAFFGGVEYLGARERSSRMGSMAPDVQINVVPHPARITIPMMCVIHKGRMAGIVWDPMQKWNGVDGAPSALFSSPDWLEGRENTHLMGLFLPSIPTYVSENSFRAHTPYEIEADQAVTIKGRIFTAPGKTTADAIDFYLREMRPLPPVEAKPMATSDTLTMLVRSLASGCWDEKAKGWPWEYGPKALPNVAVISPLLQAAPLVSDPELCRQALAVSQKSIDTMKDQPTFAGPPAFSLSLALRRGKLKATLEGWEAGLKSRMASQNADGSWGFHATEASEYGLAGLGGPPEPGLIAREGERGQGITAEHAAALLEYALITACPKAYEAARRGLKDLERYTIPTVYTNDECPPAPSLHGSIMAANAFLSAYRMDGDPRHLERAVFWAKTGLTFIYLWSLPPREVVDAEVNSIDYILRKGYQLYQNPVRSPMLYASLYGYGTSQFTFPWTGVAVQWIGLEYARTLKALASLDKSLPWDQIAEGIMVSALWQTYDQPPFAGFYPDAFSMMTWMPSGVGISPASILSSLLTVTLDRPPYQTFVLPDGATRWHVTAAALAGAPRIEKEALHFDLRDATEPFSRAIVAGSSAPLRMLADDAPLSETQELERAEEGWQRVNPTLCILKVRAQDKPRKIQVIRAGR